MFDPEKYSTMETLIFLITYYPFRSLALAGIVSWIVYKTAFGKKRKVYDLPLDEGQVKNETIAVIKIAIFDALGIAFIHYTNLFKGAESNFTNVFWTTVAMFWWVELGYYLLHRAIHSKRFYWIHRQHHVAKVSQPLTYMSFSITERFLLGMIGAGSATLFSIFVMPIPLEGVIAYTIIFILLDIFGHTNIEVFPKWWTKTPFGKVFYSATYHSMHHARYNGHYGLYTSVFDKMFGTYFDDYEAIHQRVAGGQSLTKLNERIEVNKSEQEEVGIQILETRP